MLQFYVVDNLWQGALNTSHFHCLPDAIRAYKALSPSNRKALGIQRGADAIDLVQCLPLFPNDREGEDVMVLRFLEFPLWKSDPQIMEMAQELASRLHPRYCLYRTTRASVTLPPRGWPPPGRPGCTPATACIGGALSPPRSGTSSPAPCGGGTCGPMNRAIFTQPPSGFT